MAAKKTQEESEQPAKVYQLDAIESQVKGLTEQVTTGFNRINKSVDLLVTKSESQVTPQQMADNIAALRSTFDNQIKEEIEKLHLEYRPIKNRNNWLLGTVVASAIAIFGQVVFIINLTNGN